VPREYILFMDEEKMFSEGVKEDTRGCQRIQEDTSGCQRIQEDLLRESSPENSSSPILSHPLASSPFNKKQARPSSRIAGLQPKQFYYYETATTNILKPSNR
jgi:hypothetical protein